MWDQDNTGRRRMIGVVLHRAGSAEGIFELLAAWWGWVLWGGVLLLRSISEASALDKPAVVWWLALYGLYLLGASHVRRRFRQFYDGLAPSLFRVQINVLAISALVYLGRGAYSEFWVFYLLPVFATLYHSRSLRRTAVILGETLLFYPIAAWLGEPAPSAGEFLLAYVTRAAALCVIFVVLAYLSTLSEQAQEYAAVECSRVLREVDSAVLEGKPLAVVLAIALEQSLQLLQASDGGVALLNRKTGQLDITAKHGNEVFSRTEQLKPLSFVASVLERRKAQVTDRLSNVGLLVSDRAQCVACAPVLHGGVHIGVVYIEGPSERFFDERDVQLLAMLADEVAVAVRNTELRRHRARLEEIAGVVASKRELDEILEMVLQVALELIGCPFGSIGLVNPSGTEIDFKHTQGMPSYSMPLGQGLTGKAWQLGRPVRAGDVHTAEDYIRTLEATLSELDVPLGGRGRVIGVLNAESPRLDAFTEDDEKLFVALAAQAAIAIENARHAQRLSDLNAAAGAINKALGSREQLCREVEARMTRIFSPDIASVALLSQDGKTVHLLARDDVQVKHIESHPVAGLTRWVIAKHRGIFISDATREQFPVPPDVLDTGNQRLPRSCIFQPLLASEEVVGVISVQSYRPNAFSDADRETLMTLANQIAAAVVNLRLIEQLKERARILEGLFGIAQAVVVTADMEKLKGEITEQARSTLDADIITLYEYDEQTGEFKTPPTMSGSLSGEYMASKVSDQDVPALVVRQGPPVWAEHAETDPLMLAHGQPPRADRDQRFVVREGVVSSAAVPLRAAAETVGVMFFNYRRPMSFDDETRRTIETFAQQTALVIKTARRHVSAEKTLAKQLAVVEALKEVDRAIVEGEPMARILTMLLRGAITLTAITSGVGLAVLLDERGQLVVHATWGNTGAVTVGAILPPDRDTLVWQVVEQRVGRTVFDCNEPSHPGSSLTGSRSLVAVPIKGPGEALLGVLAIESAVPNAVDPSDQLVLDRFAEQAAIVIRSEHLLQQQLAAESWMVLEGATVELAHRMHNLVGIMRLDALHLRERLEHDSKACVALDRIVSQADFLTALAENLRRPFKSVDVAELDVNEELEKALAVSHLVGVEVAADLAEELPTVRMPVMLNDVFVELLSNSSKVLGGSGWLRASSRRQENQIMVRIANSGPMIPSEIRSRIFQPFYRYQPPGEDRERAGWGFGLWWIRTFMRLHGGDVQLESSDEETGTVFLVEIPIGG